MRRLALSFMLAALAAGPAAAEQDLLLGADMASPAMTQAEMSRADVEAMIKAADGKPIDLHDKALSGLDLSGLNLRGANLRTARLNKANLRGADLSGANLEQAWFIKADLAGAKLADAQDVRHHRPGCQPQRCRPQPVHADRRLQGRQHERRDAGRSQRAAPTSRTSPWA